MKKIMKMALEAEQIKIKSQYDRFDGYEIHLYGNEKDNFELADTIEKPIITVHYPIDDCDVYDVCFQVCVYACSCVFIGVCSCVCLCIFVL